MTVYSFQTWMTEKNDPSFIPQVWLNGPSKHKMKNIWLSYTHPYPVHALYDWAETLSVKHRAKSKAYPTLLPLIMSFYTMHNTHNHTYSYP